MDTNISLIVRHLRNSGFKVLGQDGDFLVLEDPSCVLRHFETFINYAWTIIATITAFLIFGWAISMIRGAKNGVSNTAIGIRNLVIIFGILSAIYPILNVIYGGDFIGQGCKEIRVSLTEVRNILNTTDTKFKNNELYEELSIYDSGKLDGYDEETETTLSEYSTVTE